jgi:DNA-binding MarR family transcriptional regulator
MHFGYGMSDTARKQLANRMVTTLPKYGAWSEAIREYDTPLGKFGYRQLELLWALRFHLIPVDVVTPSAIAIHFEIRPSVVTGLLAKLEAQSCIARHADPQDGRSASIEITDRGIEVSVFVENVYDEEMSAALDFLEDDQVEELRQAVELLDQISTDLLRQRKMRCRAES